MKKRLFILLILTLVLAVSVNAKGLQVSSALLTENVQPGGKVSYLLNLSNTDEKAHDLTFSLDLLPANIVGLSTFDPSRIPLSINAKATRQLIVNIFLSELIPPNTNYATNLRIKSLDKEIDQKHTLTLRAIPFKELLQISFIKDKEISPGKENNFLVSIKNKGSEFIENAELKLTSDAFVHKQLINLQPLKTRDFPITINLDPGVNPSVYSLDLEVFYNNEIIGDYKTDIDVVEYKSSKDKTSQETSFLEKRMIFTRTNDGNTQIISSYSTTLKQFEKIFTTFSPKPSRQIKEEGISKYEWDFTIKPQHRYDIVVETDYKPLFYLFVLFLVAVYFVFLWLNHGVIVTKKVIKTGKEMKVALLVKNNLGIPVKNVELRDVLPKVIHPSKEYATIKPNKIERFEHSLHLTWDLLHLDKGEERIVSYKLEPKMHLLGKLKLPPARARYEHKGKDVKHYSNSVSLYPKRE